MIVRATAAQVRPLRHAVLRGPGRPLDESVYPADDDVQTVHLATLDDAGRTQAVATFFAQAAPADVAASANVDRAGRTHAWRLRGMAVAPMAQGQGLGGALLRHGLRELAARHVPLLWCNARTAALAFYRGHGLHVVGDVFATAGGVPHRRAYLVLAAPVDSAGAALPRT